MVKLRTISTTIVFACFIFTNIKHANSQPIFYIDTTDKRIELYKKTISNKKNIVQFIQQVLNKNGIPKALCNLALIESNFNPKALSWANAAGVWQIIPATAHQYGLSISATADQRYDLYKSTFAAAKNLIDLYNEYYNWQLVIAAYNCGRGNVNKAIQKAGSKKYQDLFMYLPQETIEHVNKFLLACYATNELASIADTQIFSPTNWPKNNSSNCEPVAQTDIGGGFCLAAIAQQLNINIEKIQSLNPNIEDELAKNGIAKLILPIDKMPDFLLQKNEILNQSINKK
jgi:membrane-bound lytic murein transglycosylase D